MRFCHDSRDIHKLTTTLQGFGLSFGSELYLSLSKYGQHDLTHTQALESEYLHGSFLAANGSSPLSSLGGTFMFLDQTSSNDRVVKGQC